MSSLAVVLAVLATAAEAPPPVAVLDVLDERPANQRPAGNAVQRAFEEVLKEGKTYQIAPRKPGAKASCADDECRLAYGTAAGVDRVLATRIETGHGECLVTATLWNVVSKIPEVTAYRPTLCDQKSVLSIVKNEIGPALRKDMGSQESARVKPKLVPLSDKRIVGTWNVKHVGSQKGVAPNLTGAQLHFGADGQYKGDGKVNIDANEAGQLTLAGPYGFDGKLLTIHNWGTEFESCEVLQAKPATLTAAAVKSTDFNAKSTCKVYFESANKIWAWYPGQIEGVILDTWTRAAQK